MMLCYSDVKKNKLQNMLINGWNRKDNHSEGEIHVLCHMLTVDLKFKSVFKL